MDYPTFPSHGSLRVGHRASAASGPDRTRSLGLPSVRGTFRISGELPGIPAYIYNIVVSIYIYNIVVTIYIYII